MKKLFSRRRASLAGIALCSLLSACSGDGKDSTGGKRVVLATRVEPSGAIADEFTTGTKWDVRLTSARLAIGALYYFDGAPAFALNERRKPLQIFQNFFIGTAHAHPQHYVPGSALGEMTEPSSVDLFRGAQLADGNGVTGTFRSGRLVLPEKLVGRAAQGLDGHIATARGVATQGDRTVYFDVSADLSDIRETSPLAEVDGCVFEEADVTGDGTVTLTVTPRVWFNLVDFTAIEDGEEDAPTSIVRGDVAHKGFSLGVAQLSAYRFEYSP
jgi:hypothetical protein